MGKTGSSEDSVSEHGNQGNAPRKRERLVNIICKAGSKRLDRHTMYAQGHDNTLGQYTAGEILCICMRSPLC